MAAQCAGASYQRRQRSALVGHLRRVSLIELFCKCNDGIEPEPFSLVSEPETNKNQDARGILLCIIFIIVRPPDASRKTCILQRCYLLFYRTSSPPSGASSKAYERLETNLYLKNSL